MRKAFTALFLLPLAWLTLELAWRRFSLGQQPPEVPLWACLLLLAVDIIVLASGTMYLLSPRRKIAN